MFTVPFDDLAVMFGEDVTIAGVTSQGILGRETMTNERGVYYQRLVLSLPGDTDLAKGTVVGARGGTATVEQKLLDSDPGWTRYILSEIC